MIFKFNMFGIFKKSGAEFQPYYERENDFKRQAFLHAIAALVVSPIFCLLVYNSEVPRVYILISLSYTIMFPLYIVICYFIKKLTDKLLYFFISHLFFVTFLAFQDLISSNFELFSLFCFYTLYSVVLYVIQRLYPAILYNSFVLFLLIYGFQYNDKSEISKLAVFGLFSIIACCSIIVLSSRQKMINSVEDYSNYLKKIVNNPGVGFVLLKFEANFQKLIDQNRESYKILDCKQNAIKEVVLSHLTDFEKNIIFTLKIGNSFF